MADLNERLNLQLCEWERIYGNAPEEEVYAARFSGIIKRAYQQNRTQQSYYAYGGLSVRQNLDLTGGTFYLESNLAYMRNFGYNSATQLTSCLLYTSRCV